MILVIQRGFVTRTNKIERSTGHIPALAEGD